MCCLLTRREQTSYYFHLVTSNDFLPVLQERNNSTPVRELIDSPQEAKLTEYQNIQKVEGDDNFLYIAATNRTVMSFKGR